jgi:hypothetical protein
MTLDDISPAIVRKFLSLTGLASSDIHPDNPFDSLAAHIVSIAGGWHEDLTRDVAGFLAAQTLNSLYARALEAK